jgi:hypothetical protein
MFQTSFILNICFCFSGCNLKIMTKGNVLLLMMSVRKRQKERHLKKLKLIRAKLSIRTRNYVTRQCLPPPNTIPWLKLYQDGSDENLINVISLSRAAFEVLLTAFSRHYIMSSGPGRSGRPRAIPLKSTVLGMLLQFYTAPIEYKTLSQLFAIPPATLTRTMQAAEIALQSALRELPEATIRWPTVDEQRQFAALVKDKEPLLSGRWGFVDGKNYKVQKPTSADVQNAMYNGWLHSTLITGVFCFAVDGTVSWGKHNVVGSWNDGEISRPFQAKLQDPVINLPDHGVLSDSAFPVSGGMFGRIMTPMKEGDLERAHPRARLALVLRSTAITSMRQAAEWGMGAVEKVYRQLLLPLPFNSVKRGRRINILYRLYNFRVRTTGISQIRSFFF